MRFTGSALVRLLSQLTEADVPPAKQAFSERLSGWFGWAHAISLAGALNDGSDAAPGAGAGLLSIDGVAAEAARVRDQLERAITEDFGRPPSKPAVGSRGQILPASVDADADFASWRRRYVAKQQSMEAGVHAVRGRLRAVMAEQSPEAARLAAVDEVMERVLAEQERTLLSMVPEWLAQRFGRLTAAQKVAPADDGPSPAGGCLDVLRNDMHDVLRAELDFRWQPVEGLLEALRSVPTGRNE